MYKLFEKIFKGSKESYERHLEENMHKNKKTFVVTANPEAFMIAEKDANYQKMLMDKNTEIVPDGIGLIKACQRLKIKVTERIPGIDLATHMLELADKYQKKVYLFGAKPEVIDNMKKIMQEKYAKAILVGAENGYVEDKNKVFEDMAKQEPDIVLVALGMPLQEELIYQNLKKFKKGIFIGVGGSFDVISGSKKRAPKIFIKLNLEWLYRICSEPWRFKRFWDNNVKFLLKVKKYKN